MGKFALNLRNLVAGTHTLKVLAENVTKTRHVEIRPASPLLVRYKITREATPASHDDNDSGTVPF